MRLLRYRQVGQEQPGALDALGKIRDLSGIIGDIAGAVLSAGSRAYLQQLDLSVLPVVEGNPRLGPCVGSVGKSSVSDSITCGFLLKPITQEC